MEAQCPLCGLMADVVSTTSPEEMSRTTCTRCGKFRATWRITRENLPKGWAPYLSAATRQATEAKREIGLITWNNWQQIATPHRERSISAKISMVLEFFATRCVAPSRGHAIAPNHDFPMFDCAEEAELHQYLGYLQAEKLLQLFEPNEYGPTIKGWQAVEPRVRVGGEPDRCFVAMWFDEALDDAWELGIAPAVQDCGFHPYRQKEDPTNGVVVDRIFAEIRRSHFVIADFTGQRQSVYYEVGFASGLGREIISCCKEGEARNLAFDTRHLGHIVWKSPDDLREKLTNSIRANIIPKG